MFLKIYITRVLLCVCSCGCALLIWRNALLIGTRWKPPLPKSLNFRWNLLSVFQKIKIVQRDVPKSEGNTTVCVCMFVCTLQVMSAVHGVYQALLSLKNIPTLEAAYKMVLGEMACALSSLTATLELSGRTPASDGPCSSIQHPSFASLTLPLEKAQFTLIFNLSTLTTIGNTKNSLIGVSAAVFFWCFWPQNSTFCQGMYWDFEIINTLLLKFSLKMKVIWNRFFCGVQLHICRTLVRAD